MSGDQAATMYASHGSAREMGRQPWRIWPPRRQIAALFLTFLGFYLLTASGHFYATDEETLFRATESLVERGSFAMPTDAWGLAIRPGPDGNSYPVTGPGQSVLAVPLYLLGKVVATRFPAGEAVYLHRFFVSLLGAFVTAATVALLYALGRALAYGGGASLLLAAVYGLATTAWPHGRTFFAEPLAALCLVAAFFAIRLGTAAERPRWLILGGAAVVAAIAVKAQAAIALPALGLYLAAAGAAGLTRENWRTSALRLMGWGFRFGVGMALGALPLLAYNAALFGGPFITGYGDNSGNLFTTPLLTGLYGLTLSSGKGILWYSPPLLLAPVGWWPFFRRHRPEAVACLAIVGIHLAFYSRLLFWHGDGAWGPRYLMTALPFALLPLLGLLDRRRFRVARQAAIVVFVTLGVLIQLLGVLINFDWYLQHTADEATRHFTPGASPLLGHGRLLGARAIEWRARLFPPPDTAFLHAGFSYPEGERRDEPFPRWTDGKGTVAVYPANQVDQLLVKLTFFDHRPAALRQAPPTILIDGVPLASDAVERDNVTGDGEGWVYQFAIPSTVTGRPILVTLQSPPWNPKANGRGERNEDLGVFVHNVEVWRAGVPLTIREGLAFGRRPDTPRQVFWWHNDDAIRHHPFDWWATYALASGQPRDTILGWVLAYGAVALLPLVGGLALGRRSLPIRTTGTRRQRRGVRRPGRPQGKRAARRRAQPKPVESDQTAND